MGRVQSLPLLWFVIAVHTVVWPLCTGFHRVKPEGKGGICSAKDVSSKHENLSLSLFLM